MDKEKKKIIVEFLLFGILFWTVQNIVLVYTLTNTDITVWMILMIIAMVIPFAAMTELLVERKGFERFEKLRISLTLPDIPIPKKGGQGQAAEGGEAAQAGEEAAQGSEGAASESGEPEQPAQESSEPAAAAEPAPAETPQEPAE